MAARKGAIPGCPLKTESRIEHGPPGATFRAEGQTLSPGKSPGAKPQTTKGTSMKHYGIYRTDNNSGFVWEDDDREKAIEIAAAFLRILDTEGVILRVYDQTDMSVVWANA